MKRTLRIIWVLMLGGVVVGSLAASDSSLKQAMDDLNSNDKIWHGLAYFLLALLPAVHETPLATGLQAAVALLIGLILEFGQYRFSGRSFDAGDLAANLAGVLAALAVATLLRPRLAHVEHKP